MRLSFIYTVRYVRQREPMCCANERVCILTDENWQKHRFNAADVLTWLPAVNAYIYTL